VKRGGKKWKGTRCHPTSWEEVDALGGQEYQEGQGTPASQGGQPCGCARGLPRLVHEPASRVARVYHKAQPSLPAAPLESTPAFSTLRTPFSSLLRPLPPWYPPFMERAPATGIKLEKMLLHRVGKAIGDYALIGPDDRVAVALSAARTPQPPEAPTLLRKRSPTPFELVAVTVHNGSEHFQWELLERYLTDHGIPHHVARTEITTVVEEKRRPGSPIAPSAPASGAARCTAPASPSAATSWPWGTTWTTRRRHSS